jgi:methylase of polypeptide subunit release factors
MSDSAAPRTPRTPGAASLARPTPSHPVLPPLSARAGWLARFRPPFEFGDFFSPEDTVLCAVATAWALRTQARWAAADPPRRRADDPRPRRPRRLVELTCGGALVALAQLLARPRLRAWGADVDEPAVARARRNARALGLAGRARFRTLGLFDEGLVPWLARVRPDVVACNPPYIPEPPAQRLALVAGSGSDGADHPRRAIDVCADAAVPRLVLSWCSLGDPVGVAQHAARRGYALERLWVAAIADGEYSGMAHDHVRTLPTAFLRESRETLLALAPDGAARFAYLLLCASFAREGAPGWQPAGGDHEAVALLTHARRREAGAEAARRAGVHAVAHVIRAFSRDGLSGLAAVAAERTPGPRVRAFAADRWDELVMRASAHGQA